MTDQLNPLQRRAVAWAKARVGDTGWNNLCLSFVRQAFAFYYNPESAWPTSKRMAGYAWDNAKHKHPETNPEKIPGGVPVFFELPSEADHVALSLGDGWCISNDFMHTVNPNIPDGRIDRVRIADIAHRWGPLKGWTEDLVGNQIVSEPPKVNPKISLLSLQFTPMQWSDSAKEKTRDAERIFLAAHNDGIDICGGTESGGSRSHPLQEVLPEAAEKYGFHFHLGLSTWVAIRKTSIERGTFHHGTIPVLRKGEGSGSHGDRGIAWASGKFPGLGVISTGVGHKLTDGRKPGQPNYKLNLEYDEAAGQFAHDFGQSTALAFYMADQNMSDTTNDTFHGQPLLSAADELKEWAKTHPVGDIDVVASYDRDGRVHASEINVIRDAKLDLATDHYVTRVKYAVNHLKGK